MRHKEVTASEYLQKLVAARMEKVYLAYDIRKPAMNIIIDQTHINQYPEGVSIVLNVLGHPEALVSDLSEIGDFDPSEETLSLLDAKRGDVLWEIAARIEKENEE